MALLAINALITGAANEPAEVTRPDGRILSLPGGDLQVVDQGPRNAPSIVLIHGFACAIDWWDGMMPLLGRHQRVIAIDLLGHGGSEKPDSGYEMERQAELVAQALRALHVRDATVVGHSMGAVVATALHEATPELVDRIVIVDQAPDSSYGTDLPVTVDLTFTPLIGEAIWRVTPDFAIKDGLSVGFAPGYEVPAKFVEDFRRLTYASYDESAAAETAYTDDLPLDERLRRTRIPLLAVFGAEEQIYVDPEESLAAYRAVGAQTKLILGAGHSPNVERPAQTAKLVMRFANEKGPPEGGP
ncbi:MAG TPA: alpha/beta hydrolase [Solirubrobacterales bacterium]|nr:alpha/beta hydrolase [Solirubrobacterales bacterium]